MVSSGTFVYVFASPSPTSTYYAEEGVYPGAPSYTVWVEGSTYYAKDANGHIAYMSSNATQLIQNTLSNNSNVFFGVGSFELDPSVDLANLYNVTLQGSGIDSTVLVAGSTSGAFDKSGDGASCYVTLKDMTIDGAGINAITVNLGNNTQFYRLYNLRITNSGKHLMYASVAKNITIQNCVFDKSGLAVSADLVPMSIYDGLICGNTFIKTEGIGGACFTSGHLEQVEISNNRFITGGTCYAALSLENNYNVFRQVIVTNNIATGANYSAHFNIGNSNNHLFKTATVEGNIILGGGISSLNVHDLIIQGNRIENSTYGICIYNSSDVIVNGNIVENTGITSSQADKSGIYAVACVNVTISSNRIKDTQVTKTTPHGIYTNANFSLIQGNWIWNMNYSGINIKGINNTICDNMVFDSVYGILIDTGADYNFLHGNYLLYNSSNSISDNGTGTYKRDNVDESGLLVDN